MSLQLPPLVVMGVQGCGKSTVGAAVAQHLGLEFIDGDDLHSAANKEKMASGHPLTDADRHPWLSAIGQVMADKLEEGTTAVVACSSLKRSYRDLIRSFAPETRFIHLVGSRELIAARISGRDHEYMPPTLLDSQFQTLEPLGEDEAGLEVPVTDSPEQIAVRVESYLQEAAGSTGTEGSTHN
ncbi:gluconokinase [Arthrobacter sp. CAU 1506]|uniref:gluconokinase n=1 Tax=Arthrobacter sp. CAU 1506 TaxID=2560052 RepID=UPI0010AD09B5|nr:gluconokinase [Arthrobacter sp. CAU 1506]TJY72535.1 gluconokinase [Arthrobacter sp. CAU 1506]